MTQPARVLVVDDHPTIRELWCQALVLFGYEVTPARDGAEALALFDGGLYDLVLTDLLMPGMTGWQLAETIWARSSVPVILVTGSATGAALTRAQADGVVLLHKPVTLPDLKRAVAQALGRTTPLS